jgi:poly(hydroxyalkanoate) granule-associated protein
MSSKKSSSDKNGYELARLIRTSAHDIWLAGLGAYSRAGKEGTRFFESLVALGESVERRAREQVARPFRVAERRVENARSAVNDTWERLELMFERRVARALHSLQIPTQRDVAELTQRVESLQEALQAVTGTGRRKAARRPSRVALAGKGTAAKTKARTKKSSAKTGSGRRRPVGKSKRSRAKSAGATRS